MKNAPLARSIIEARVPTIIVGAADQWRNPPCPLSTASELSSDSRAIGKMAAEYFLEFHHTSYAFVGEIDDYNWSRRRRDAFAETLAGAGFACEIYRPTTKASGDWASGSSAACTTPNDCIKKISTTDRTMMLATEYVDSNHSRGWNFANGTCRSTLITTVLPPNTGTCEKTGAATGTRGFFSTTSYHPGGVNTLRADGSVHFVADTINCGNLDYDGDNAAREPSGVSPFGVWGALGSIAGGETSKGP